MRPSAMSWPARSSCCSKGEGNWRSMKARTCDSGSAPRNWSTARPLRKANTAGIERTLNAAASSWFSSELTFTSLKRPAYSRSSFSSIGPRDLHGPHHGAQKSTSTGTAAEASRTSRSKLTLLMSMSRSWSIWGRGCDNQCHDLRRHRRLHQVQVHGLHRGLPGGLLLRGRQHARHPPGRMHRLRGGRARVPAEGHPARFGRQGREVAQEERGGRREMTYDHAQGQT